MGTSICHAGEAAVVIDRLLQWEPLYCSGFDSWDDVAADDMEVFGLGFMRDRDEELVDAAVLVFTDTLRAAVGGAGDQPGLGNGREFCANALFLLARFGGCEQDRHRQSECVRVAPRRLARSGEEASALGHVLG